jgi:hypothetical protein
MVRTGILAAALVLLALLSACGDDPAPRTPGVESTPPHDIQIGPIPEIPYESAPEPEPEPDRAPEAPTPPAEVPEPKPSSNEEFQPPPIWCGTDLLGGPFEIPRLDRWHEVTPGLWRRVLFDRGGGLPDVVEWGVDRDGKFVTWQEVLLESRRPLFGAPRIPDRPRKRPPR